MDIREVLNEYDSMFAVNTPEEIETFLKEHVNMAEKEGDKASLLALLNEQIGFARDRGMKEEAIAGCRRLMDLTAEMGLKGTIQYGKTMLNIANGYRAFGLYNEAEELFNEIEQLYLKILPEGAYDYAPLYNNWSLLAMDAGDPERACDLIRLSIDVVDRYEGAVINRATSRVNLACALMDMAGDESALSEKMREASDCIDEAIRLFETQGGDDYHFAAALAAKGDFLMKTGGYEAAAEIYDRAADIVRRYLGNSMKAELLDKKKAAAERMINS